MVLLNPGKQVKLCWGGGGMWRKEVDSPIPISMGLPFMKIPWNCCPAILVDLTCMDPGALLTQASHRTTVEIWEAFSTTQQVQITKYPLWRIRSLMTFGKHLQAGLFMMQS